MKTYLAPLAAIAFTAFTTSGRAVPTVTASVVYGHAAETNRDRGVFGIERTGDDLSTPLTVYFGFSGTATLGADYDADPAQGAITIPAQASGVQVYVTPIDDVLIEGPESIVLTLTPDANYLIASPGSATIVIEDNDSAALPTVTVTAWPPFAEERQYPPPYVPVIGGFTLHRTGGTSAPLTVYLNYSGTALNGVDYARLPDSVTFPSGVFFTALNVVAIDDTEPEGPETAVLAIAPNAAYLVGSPGSDTVVIVDDDQPLPVVSVQATDADAAEAGPDPGTFTLRRSGDADQPLTIFFQLGGTAVPGTDYLLNGQRPDANSSITFQPGQSELNLVVTPLDDNLNELAEVVILAVMPDPRVVTYYTVASPASAEVTIADHDTIPPVIARLTASPNSLWPPDHQLVAVALAANVSDDRDPAPRARIVSVTSNEPAAGTGDDDRAPDWIITGDLALQLRAERAENGGGRTYTITVEARDASGNASRRSTTVAVPKSHAKN